METAILNFHCNEISDSVQIEYDPCKLILRYNDPKCKKCIGCLYEESIKRDLQKIEQITNDL